MFFMVFEWVVSMVGVCVIMVWVFSSVLVYCIGVGNSVISVFLFSLVRLSGISLMFVLVILLEVLLMIIGGCFFCVWFCGVWFGFWRVGSFVVFGVLVWLVFVYGWLELFMCCC